MIVSVERKEWPALFGSFAYFFCLLCAYYIIRPVRDEMGILIGTEKLSQLFTIVFFVMLALTPVFGWLITRFPRKVTLPLIYAFFAFNLLVFWWLFAQNAKDKDVATVFYVWVSVFNLFAVSVFWSFMVDLWDEPQSKRLFGIIAAGGTSGALVGPIITASLVKSIGVANLLPISAVFLGGCIAALLYLSFWARQYGTAKAKEEKPLGGGILDGIKLVASKPQLLWMCALLLLMAIAGTLMYFEQQRLVAKAFASSTERTQYFAQLDLITNAVVLFIEIFLTSEIIKRFGLLPALLALPILTVVGFIWLAINPVLMVIATMLVLRRAAEYALAKPAREVLFTVLSKEEKYKAKNVIDTVVHRAGDATGAWLSTALKSLAPSTGEVALMLTPVGLVSCGVAWYLARAHEAKNN